MALNRYVVTGTVNLAGSVPGAGTSVLVDGVTSTGPASGTPIATTATLPGGMYEVTVTIMLSGTVTFADANNTQLKVGSTVVGPLDNQGSAEFDNVNEPTLVEVPPAGAAISVTTVGAGSGTAAYYAQINVTPAVPAEGPAGSGETPEGSAAPLWNTTLLPGTAIVLDPAGALFALIGGGNLRAYTQGTDDVGHAALSN